MLRVTRFQLRTLLTLLAWVMEEGEAKRREIRPGRNPDVDRYDEVYVIVRNTFLLTLAPLVIHFIYSIWSDPDLPQIRRALWSVFRQRLLRNLSNDGNHPHGKNDVYKKITEDNTEPKWQNPYEYEYNLSTKNGYPLTSMKSP